MKCRDCGCELDISNQTKILYVKSNTTVELDICISCYEERMWDEIEDE